jgi:cbb3-type cytochrome oxidase maturation protein
MDVLIYLIPIALGLGLLGLFGFMWSLRAGQYDDLEGAKWRILENDDLPSVKAAAPVELPAPADMTRHAGP